MLKNYQPNYMPRYKGNKDHNKPREREDDEEEEIHLTFQTYSKQSYDKFASFTAVAGEADVASNLRTRSRLAY